MIVRPRLVTALAAVAAVVAGCGGDTLAVRDRVAPHLAGSVLANAIARPFVVVQQRATGAPAGQTVRPAGFACTPAGTSATHEPSWTAAESRSWRHGDGSAGPKRLTTNWPSIHTARPRRRHRLGLWPLFNTWDQEPARTATRYFSQSIMNVESSPTSGPLARPPITSTATAPSTSARTDDSQRHHPAQPDSRARPAHTVPRREPRDDR